MYEKQVALEQQIERLRNKLAKLASNKGYTHSETITVSQELDALLNIYNRKRL